MNIATLTVLKFDTPGGAQHTLEVIQNLSRMQLITLQDSAVVSWPVGKKKPKTEQSKVTGLGAMSGAFWGILFGLLFTVPIFGLVAGTALGALAGSLVDVGINDDFIKSVRTQVTEGTSALFLLTSDAVEDKVKEALKDIDFEIIATNLSKEEEDKLREMFAEEEEEVAPVT